MAHRSVRRIGILTGGGDCPGLNAVIRAATRVAINGYGVSVLGIQDGFEGLILPGKTRELRLQDVAGILPRGGTILGTSNRGNPFAWKVERDGREELQDVSAKLISNLEFLGVDALVVVGGDGTLKIGKRLHELGVPVVGVPKTIDNDLSATDVTFGFNTAVATATEALDRLHTTAESHHRVMVVEVMGRNSGWIAIEAGMAGGADVILIPEIPFELRWICQKIEERLKAGSKFSIIVVAEGAYPEGGQRVVKRAAQEGGLGELLGGIGQQVGDQVAAMTGMEVRITVLGHLQRGGSPTPFDRNLGSLYGIAAVKAVMESQFGKMVALRTPNIQLTTLEEAVGKLKTIPPDGQEVQAAEALGISFGRR